MIIKPDSKYLLPLIEKAWASIKGGGDPEFHSCHTDHQATLIYKAESVVQTGSTGEDAFSIAFKKLFDAAKAPAAAETTEKPKGKK